MRHVIAFSLVLFCAAFTARGGEDAAPTAPSAQPAARKTIVYYFHGTARCPTCMKLEAYTREVVEESLSSQVKSGRVEWRVINTDEAANAHYRTDYKLENKSVVVVEMDGTKQLRWKNLEKIWDLVGTKDAFKKYINDEVLAYMSAK